MMQFLLVSKLSLEKQFGSILVLIPLHRWQMGIETKKVCLGKSIDVYQGKRARLGRRSCSLWYKPERVSMDVHCMRMRWNARPTALLHSSWSRVALFY